jgi:hypothetical protein
MKKLLSLCCAAILAFPVSAQPTADEVMQVTRLANDYFMSKYSDPTVPTNVKRVRPSSLWTRAVYYEGLMALYDIDPQQRYLDYTDKWASSTNGLLVMELLPTMPTTSAVSRPI